MRGRPVSTAALGWRSHSGWAVLVAVGGSSIAPIVLDRQRVALMNASLPRQPYHAAVEDELSPEAAAVLISRVERAAAASAASAIKAVVAKLDESGRSLAGVGLVAGDRRIPDELSRILASHALLHAAEGELYERAVIEASSRAGLRVTTLAPKNVIDDAATAMSMKTADLGTRLTAAGKTVGPPWQKDHREAAAVALVALTLLTSA